MYAKAARAYRNVYLESASPTRLLDELYERLLKDVSTAAAGIAARDPRQRGEAISHALAIVSELTRALDRRVAPELCARLAALYDFVAVRLTRANLHDDCKALAEVEPIIITLRDSFREAAQQ